MGVSFVCSSYYFFVQEMAESSESHPMLGPCLRTEHSQAAELWEPIPCW